MKSSAGRRLFLTKSMFLQALQCPRKVHYQNNPDQYPAIKNDLLQSLANGGEQIQQYCRLKHYPNGTDMTKFNDLEESLAETRRLILNTNKHETRTLLEAPVCYKNMMARIDALRIHNHNISVIEIKAKSWDSRVGRKDIEGKRTFVKKKYLRYIQDVAYQCLVVKRAFPDYKVTGWLQLPDKSKTCEGIGLNSLFPMNNNNEIQVDPETKSWLEAEPSIMSLIDIDEYVQHILGSPLTYPGKPLEHKDSTMEDVMEMWQDKLTSEETPFSHEPPPIGSQCSSCEFRNNNETERSGFHECWRLATGLSDSDLEKPVVDLWNSSGKDTFISNKKYLLADLNHDDLKYNEDDAKSENHISRAQRQLYQACGIPTQDDVGGGLILKSDYLRKQMSTWRYPLHFVDFETATPALPFFPGMSPYETVAFQFSHHVLQRDGMLEHKEQFLHTLPGENPNAHFVDALVETLESDDGTVFMYSPHESKTLASLLARHTSEKASPLQQLLPGQRRAMVDLAILTERGMFLEQAGGGNSLKKIIPPLLACSSELKHLYGRPTYGGRDFTSLNFQNMQWWQRARNGSSLCEDPYNLLPSSQHEQQVVADGSAAMAAYHVLQWDLVSTVERDELTKNMMRYCELDTLAMAMVIQAWKALCKHEWL